LSPVLPRVFTTDPAVIDRAAAGLLVLAIALLPGAVAFGLDGVLIGAAEYRFLSVLMIVSFAVFALAIVVLTRPAGAGIVTIWLAVATWMGARAVGCAWRWHVLRGGRLLVR
jgi:Na+-driven multidrug efflux pump